MLKAGKEREPCSKENAAKYMFLGLIFPFQIIIEEVHVRLGFMITEHLELSMVDLLFKVLERLKGMLRLS